MSKIVLVIGATGMLGRLVAQQLNNDGFIVRVLARDIEKANKLFDNTFQKFQGDIFDKESLQKALSGCYGVHINLQGSIEFTGTQQIVEEAIKANIHKISYISGTTVFEGNRWFPMIDTKFKAEQLITNSQIPYSIFCPSWFMEGLGKMIKGDKAFMFGKQPKPFHFVAGEDYARMVSKSYQLEETNNKRFFIHGPESYLFKEALETYLKARNPEIKSISQMPYLIANLIALIKGKPAFKEVVKMMQYFEKVGEMGDPTETNDLLGKPKTTLDEWLNNHKKEAL